MSDQKSSSSNLLITAGVAVLCAVVGAGGVWLAMRPAATPAPAPAAAPAAPAAGAPAAPAADTPAAPAAQQQAQGPQPVQIDRIEDWTVQCQVMPDGRVATCFNIQERYAPNGAPMAMIVGLGPEDRPAVTFVGPLGLVAGVPIKMKIGGGEEFSLPWGACLQIGCTADLPMSAERADALKGGDKVSATYSAGGEQAITVDFSLKGFTGAYDRLKAVVAEIAARQQAAQPAQPAAQPAEPAPAPAAPAAPQ
jgi:invasion protein IalB